jgi:hypothetical protein
VTREEEFRPTLGFRGVEEEGESLGGCNVVLIVDVLAATRPKQLLPIRVRLHEGDEDWNGGGFMGGCTSLVEA